MKKFVFGALLFALCGFLFAENFTVKAVTGKVTYEASAGKFSDLTVGKTIAGSTIINTSLNSTVTLTAEDGSEVVIKAMSKGPVDSLVAAFAKSSKGLKKNPALAKTDVAGESKGGSSGTATASSRASEAKEDLDWDE